MNLYQVAYHHASTHGVSTAVHIPDNPDPVPDTVLHRLHPDEANHAKTLRGYRQVQYVGGRIALRRACEQLGVRPPPLLSDDRGAPILPKGVAGSISHKKTLAIAMVANANDGTLGVDLEEYEPMRLSISSHVLTPSEELTIAELPDERRWIAMVLRFSIKESIYKALDPYVHRYVGFHEAQVEPDLNGGAKVKLNLVNGEGPFTVDAKYKWIAGRLLTSVRIKPVPSTGG